MTNFQLSWDRALSIREIYLHETKQILVATPMRSVTTEQKRVKLTVKFHRQKRLTFWRILTFERDGQHK